MNQRIEPIDSRPAWQAAGLAFLTRIGEAAADLFFPPRCIVCQRLGAWLCADCTAEIEMIHPPVCHQCGLPLDAHRTDGPCRTPSPLDGLRACAFHGGPLREAIHHFKYEGLTALAAPLSRLMAGAWPALEGGWQPEVVVPVPLHSQRQRQRGYNQSALLARGLAAALRLPVEDCALRRIRSTAPQVDLDAAQRKVNVQDAFRCQPGRLAGRAVLLVDDVCTTGATLVSAGRALKEAGASCVVAYTLARARPPGERKLSLGS